MTKIKYKGKTLWQVPKNTTKEEIEELIRNGAKFYIRENDSESVKNLRND